MSIPGNTVTYISSLGAADYTYYSTINNNFFGKTYFLVTSIALDKESNLNLNFEHEFFSKSLSEEENNKFINDLSEILGTVNATNITATIRQNTLLNQTILVSYQINDVEQSNVDTLTTAIATVCINAIDDISLPIQ
jgi:hypothetical protein